MAQNMDQSFIDICPIRDCSNELLDLENAIDVLELNLLNCGYFYLCHNKPKAKM